MDNEALYRKLAREAVEADSKAMASLQGDGFSWGGLKHLIKARLPNTAPDPDRLAFQLVAPTLLDMFGSQDVGWHTFRSQSRATEKTGTRKP